MQVVWARHNGAVKLAAVLVGLLAMALAGGAANPWPTG
jgi:hypothetical protein